MKITESQLRSIVTEVIACGDCYRWAWKYVLKHDDAIMVHGTIQQPFSSDKKKINHAWVEHNGKVMDWQTMEAMYGGIYQGKGYPSDVFYETWSAIAEKEYDFDGILEGLKNNGHYGPWH
tara:strand:+ start:127 stop:486 length:360 start_codon:yes stop_codon:yes gene_type:complete